MFDITEFRGEIPQLHPRRLPPGYAQRCNNAKLERGVLSPYRTPDKVADVPATTETITFFGGQWLAFDSVVDAVPGPVAADRLYITGSGVPKVRLTDGTQYNLKWEAPAAVPAARLLSNGEHLNIDGRFVRLIDGNRTGGTTISGLTMSVAVTRNTATVTIKKAAGLTVSQAQTLINQMRYSNVSVANRMAKSLKIIKITAITDSGGQTLDSDGDPIGGPTRIIDDVVTTVRVGGTTLTYSPPTQDAQDGTDISGQNDPPTLAVDAVNSLFSYGDHPPGVPLFENATISTIEASQSIISITVVVEGLTNATLDPDTQETISYCYTAVSVLDEESQPSPLVSMEWSQGQGVLVSGMTSPPGAGARLKAKRIYRAQTSASGGTDLYFIAEIAPGATTFLDFPDEIPLQETLASLDYDLPPDDLAGLVSLPNGIIAGFIGRQICFCEPWRPHAWPIKYRLTAEHQIVGLSALGSTLMALTTGMPYAITGTHPESMQMVKIEQNAPCASKRSIVDLGYAAAYASADGLIVIDASGGVRLATRGLFTDTQWANMVPAQMIASQYQNRYVLSHPSKGSRETVIIDLAGEQPFVIRTEWDAFAYYYSLTSARIFYMRDAGGIFAADPLGGDYAPLRWRSGPLVLPAALNMGAMLVEGDTINAKTRLVAKVYGDGKLRATVTKPNQIVRLPGGYMAREWAVEVWGNFQITGIHMAATVDDLKARSAG